MRNTNRLLLIPYLIWMVLFIIIPVVLLVYYSFLDNQGHFSLTNYENIFTLSYLKMFADSILFAVIITLVTLLISYPAAYYIAQSKYQNLLLMIMIIPTWINLLLKTYAFIGLLSHDGLINQLFNIFNLSPINMLFTAGAFIVVSSYIYI
ncbi:ABC transporter permease, partial [Staphylococcus warneri]